MVAYKRTNITSKAGVNFLRTLVEGAGCLFHKIDHESDLGVDALIELIGNERPLGVQVAVQLKSGESYYRPREAECLIPIASHREYWASYPLPIIGVVYVPTLARGHWIDLKRALLLHPTAAVIAFKATGANRIDRDTFQSILLPMLLRETPDIPFEAALAFFRSRNLDEVMLGLIVLFRRYANRTEVWDAFVRYFVENAPHNIPPILLYYLAHIPGHGDIAYSGEQLTSATKAHGQGLLDGFQRSDLVKLLGFIDKESMISRGSLGQSIEALVSSLDGADTLLEEIARDPLSDLFTRECASLILAMHVGKDAMKVLRPLAEAGSWYAAELTSHLERYGAVNPYG